MRFLRVACVALGLGRAVALSTTPPDVEPRADLQSLVERGLAEDLWNEIKDGASCAGCEAIIILLKGLALLGDKIFVKTLQEICKLSNAEDDDVCEGAIGLEGPIIARSIRNMKVPSQTSKLFCLNFLGVCDFPAVTPFKVPLPSEKPAGLTRPGPSGKAPIKIVHYSDVHTDHLYTPGSTANCTKPICCRPYTKDDAPGVSNSPAGPNGDHHCDTPITLEQSMYAAINEIAPDAAFSLCTGDIVDHTVWNTSKEFNTISINGVYSRMAAALGTVYGAAGNHEAHPTNAFAPSSINSDSQWVYSLLSNAWTRWIGADAASTTQRQGRYSILHPGSKLRIISLNTNMYYVQNYWLYQRDMERDPESQIAWFASELDAAERNNERVYVIGHMPLGDRDAFHDQSNYIDQLVARYSDTIAAMFFGHTHVDEFQVSYAAYGKGASRNVNDARAISYIAPSLTPTSGMPSFRVYSVDPDTFAVLDAVTYIADMSKPEFQTSTPKWQKFYSAKETYGPLVNPPVTDPAQELTPAFWHRLTETFAANQSAFDGYVLRKSRGWKADGSSCAGACRDNEVCYMRGGRAENNCYDPEPGVHFSKRALNPIEERDDCGISVSRATIGSLAVRRDSLRLLKKRALENNAPLVI